LELDFRPSVSVGNAPPALKADFVVTDDRGTGFPTSGALFYPFNSVLLGAVRADGIFLAAGGSFMAAYD